MLQTATMYLHDTYEWKTLELEPQVTKIVRK